MQAAIALLLLCQLAGEAIHRFTGLPLPGSVIGIALLLLWMGLFRKERPSLTQAAGWLTANLALMFVPAAVGVMTEGPVLAKHGLVIALATVVSTLLTIAVTGLVFRWALRRAEPEL